MSNSLKSLSDKVTVHGYNEFRFNHFAGRVMTLIETLGLGESQERAFKDIVKQEIWSLWERPNYIEEKDPLVLGKE